MAGAMIPWKSVPSETSDASDGEENGPSDQKSPKHATNTGPRTSEAQHPTQYATSEKDKTMMKDFEAFRDLQLQVDNRESLPSEHKRLIRLVIQTHVDATLKERELRDGDDDDDDEKNIAYVTEIILRDEIERWIRRDIKKLRRLKRMIVLEETAAVKVELEAAKRAA